MAIKTYLYRSDYIDQIDLTSLLDAAANPTIGVPTGQLLLPITVDDTVPNIKADLDEAMASLGYVYVAEQTGAIGGTHTDHGVLLADPVDPVPTAGDTYYNSALHLPMFYDGFRSKWVSVETSELMFGRDGSTAPGQYFRAVDGRVMSDTIGLYAMRSGTVVTLAYSRSNAVACSFEITVNGVTVHTVASAAAKGRDIAINADFNFGDIIAVRNRNPGGVPTDVVGWLRVKWRV